MFTMSVIHAFQAVKVSPPLIRCLLQTCGYPGGLLHVACQPAYADPTKDWYLPLGKSGGEDEK